MPMKLALSLILIKQIRGLTTTFPSDNFNIDRNPDRNRYHGGTGEFPSPDSLIERLNNENKAHYDGLSEDLKRRLSNSANHHPDLPTKSFPNQHLGREKLVSGFPRKFSNRNMPNSREGYTPNLDDTNINRNLNSKPVSVENHVNDRSIPADTTFEAIQETKPIPADILEPNPSLNQPNNIENQPNNIENQPDIHEHMNENLNNVDDPVDVAPSVQIPSGNILLPDFLPPNSSPALTQLEQFSNIINNRSSIYQQQSFTTTETISDVNGFEFGYKILNRLQFYLNDFFVSLMNFGKKFLLFGMVFLKFMSDLVFVAYESIVEICKLAYAAAGWIYEKAVMFFNNVFAYLVGKYLFILGCAIGICIFVGLGAILGLFGIQIVGISSLLTSLKKFFNNIKKAFTKKTIDFEDDSFETETVVSNEFDGNDAVDNYSDEVEDDNEEDEEDDLKKDYSSEEQNDDETEQTVEEKADNIDEKASENEQIVEEPKTDEIEQPAEEKIDNIEDLVNEDKLFEKSKANENEQMVEEPKTDQTEQPTEDKADNIDEKASENEQIVEESKTDLTEQMVEESKNDLTEQMVEEPKTDQTEQMVEESKTDLTEQPTEDKANNIDEKASENELDEEPKTDQTEQPNEEKADNIEENLINENEQIVEEASPKANEQFDENEKINDKIEQINQNTNEINQVEQQNVKPEMIDADTQVDEALFETSTDYLQKESNFPYDLTNNQFEDYLVFSEDFKSIQ